MAHDRTVYASFTDTLRCARLFCVSIGLSTLAAASFVGLLGAIDDSMASLLVARYMGYGAIGAVIASCAMYIAFALTRTPPWGGCRADLAIDHCELVTGIVLAISIGGLMVVNECDLVFDAALSAAAVPIGACYAAIALFFVISWK